jgi:hypothetical protein
MVGLSGVWILHRLFQIETSDAAKKSERGHDGRGEGGILPADSTFCEIDSDFFEFNSTFNRSDSIDHFVLTPPINIKTRCHPNQPYGLFYLCCYF